MSERFLAARAAGGAALREFAAATAVDDEGLLELLALAETPERRQREELERLLTVVVLERSRRREANDDELFWMAVERWRASRVFDPQIASDVMASILERCPGSERALSTWIVAALRDQPYLHRGVDLEAIAAKTARLQLAARLLATHALIRCAADDGSTAHARVALARALALDPNVDAQSLRDACLDAMGLGAEAAEDERDSALPPVERW